MRSLHIPQICRLDRVHLKESDTTTHFFMISTSLNGIITEYKKDLQLK